MGYYIKEFLNNPAGKGSAVLNISATKEKFNIKYNEIHKKISHRSFSVKDDIYILVNIPSSVEGIFYDVLLKFIKNNKSIGSSILDMDMQIFSNSPSFLYTYANAYDKNKLFIRDCKKKLSSKMLSDIAKTRNPYGVLSYDFSVYSALYYIVTNGYTNISDLEADNNHIKTNLRVVLSFIKNADELQKTRKSQKNFNKLMELEKIKKSKNKAVKKDINTENTESSIKLVTNVKNNKHVKKTKSSKYAKKI